MFVSPDPPATPRPAAALILVDTSDPPQVLLAKRNESLAFMGGQYCFPGGRIHPGEGARLVRNIPPDRRDALHAAVRETFEETGLLCVEGSIPDETILRDARTAAIASHAAFNTFLAEHKLWIDGGKFENAGEWVTPPISPIRFQTQYFLFRYHGPKNESLVGDEMTDLQWIEPQEARRRWRIGEWETSTPVGFALSRLANEPNVGDSTVRAILLTHSHRDHVGAADMLRRRLGIEIWAHALTGEQLHMPLDRHLEDGDIIELPGDPPWRLRCIHTPGHDPGHLCFLEESTRMLIAGDMVANPGSIYIAPKLRGDMNAYLDSLERLKTIPFDRIVPGHGIPLQHGAHDLIQRHIDHRLRREAKIVSALQENPPDFKSLLRRVYDDVDESALVLAEGSLRAHLVRLNVIAPRS